MNIEAFFILIVCPIILFVCIGIWAKDSARLGKESINEEPSNNHAWIEFLSRDVVLAELDVIIDADAENGTYQVHSLPYQSADKVIQAGAFCTTRKGNIYEILDVSSTYIYFHLWKSRHDSESGFFSSGTYASWSDPDVVRVMWDDLKDLHCFPETSGHLLNVNYNKKSSSSRYDRQYCKYCNGTTFDDFYGNCSACGGPR
jgi:hypothetical protein